MREINNLIILNFQKPQNNIKYNEFKEYVN